MIGINIWNDMMPLKFPLAAILAVAICLPVHAADDIAAKLAGCNQAISEGDASKALALAEQVLSQQANNRDALMCKGRAYGGTGKTKEALEALRAGEKLSQKPLDRIIALTLIGNVHKSAGESDAAMQAYQQSLELSRSERNVRFERINLNLIGETQVSSQQLDKALESFLAGSKLAANDNERADNYARIADVYNKQGKHDQAIEYQVKAVLMQERSGDADSFAGATLELGRMYGDAKDYVNAEKYTNKIIKLGKDQGGPYWEAMGYYYLAKSKAKQGLSAEARKLLEEAQQISDVLGARALSEEIKLTMGSLTN
jgi:tetratricopeptide (TPR) repeat protein